MEAAERHVGHAGHRREHRLIPAPVVLRALRTDARRFDHQIVREALVRIERVIVVLEGRAAPRVVAGGAIAAYLKAIAHTEDGVCLVCVQYDDEGNCVQTGGCTLYAAIQEANRTGAQDVMAAPGRRGSTLPARPSRPSSRAGRRRP